MYESNLPIWQLVLSIGLVGSLTASTAGEERLLVPGVGEVIVDSAETRKQLLTTELAVSRELIELARGRLTQATSSPKLSFDIPANKALLMIERIRATSEILEQLGMETPLPQSMRRGQLILEVLVARHAIEEARQSLRSDNVAVSVATKAELLRAVTPLLSRMLDLAKVCGMPDAEHLTFSAQWLELERRIKLLLERPVEQNQLERIRDVSEASQQLVIESQRLVDTLWSRCSGELQATYDPAAISTDVEKVRSDAKDWLAACDLKIGELLPKGTPAYDLRQLQVKKLALLRDLRDATAIEARLGISGRNREYLRLLSETTDAELALCRSREERITRHRAYVSKLTQTLSEAESAYRQGIYPRDDIERLKIQLLDADISLLGERL